MNTDKTITAVFIASSALYDLTVNTTGSGSILKDPDQTHYLTGTTVSLTATPDTGFIFDHWEGDVTGSENPVKINVSGSNKTVTATFLALYTLNVSAIPDNSGEIKITPSQSIYKQGTSISIFSLPKPGYAFSSWSGDLTGNTNPATVIMNSNKVIVVNFQASTATYALNTSVTGPGTITKNPNQSEYLTGTTVNVTATPNSGCFFDHWERDISGSDNPVNINMNCIKNISAVFIGQRGNLSDTVVESLGGSAVSNASVSINGTGKTALTDDTGFFSIKNIPIGTYDVIISKNGNAGSKLQAVEILDGFTTKVELVDTAYDFSSSLTTPPTISISGMVKGGSYSGTLSITVNVDAGSCSVLGNSSHSSIYLKTGYTGIKEDGYSNNNSLIYNLDTSKYPSGPINIKVVSYDINNNRSELNIPVNISGSSGSVPSVKPDYRYYDIEADTYGSSLEIYKQTKKSFNFLPDNRLNKLNSSTLMNAPNNSTIMVKFWLYVYDSYNTKGITILRSTSQNGSYVEVGKTNYTISQVYNYSTYYFYFLADYSSDLTPGNTYWYKIAYYNSSGTGTFSDPVSVLILPNYNLDLVSPSNNSVITSNSTSLTWVTSSIAGADRYDWVQVRDILSNTIVYETPSDSPLVNSTRYTLSSLAYNKQYIWDVTQSTFQYKNSNYVYSVSLPSSGGNSSNGAFSFSTVNP
jgi:hypothetical protein